MKIRKKILTKKLHAVKQTSVTNRVKHTRSTSSEIDHEFIVLEMWNSLTKEIYSVYVYNIYFIMN